MWVKIAGTVVVNGPSLIAYAMPQLAWGAAPGHTPLDIQSGIGFIRNRQSAPSAIPFGPLADPLATRTPHGSIGRHVALARPIPFGRYMALARANPHDPH